MPPFSGSEPMTRDDWRKINLSIPKALLARVDDYRYANKHPTRAEAMRQLLEQALRTTPNAPPEEKPRPENPHR